MKPATLVQDFFLVSANEDMRRRFMLNFQGLLYVANAVSLLLYAVPNNKLLQLEPSPTFSKEKRVTIVAHCFFGWGLPPRSSQPGELFQRGSFPFRTLGDMKGFSSSSSSCSFQLIAHNTLFSPLLVENCCWHCKKRCHSQLNQHSWHREATAPDTRPGFLLGK